MAVRIKDGMIPYTWGVGIEITNNHVINVLLRELNNLIQVNEDRELYVDLQLPDGITPEDDFPVGVTTGRILQEDWWEQSGTMLNWKTTSGDQVSLIYANDWNLYYSVNLGERHLIASWWILQDINTRTFYPQNLSDSTVGQQAIDWYLAWKNPIIIYNGESYVVESQPQSTQVRFQWIHVTNDDYMNAGYTRSIVKQLYLSWDANNEFAWWMDDDRLITSNYIAAGKDYSTAYNVTYDSDPTTKLYVDTELALKQDKLTAWTRITIDPVTNVISADVSWVMTYMWNVTDSSQLPTTWNNQWDCWYDETDNTLRAWDWTQWNDIGGPWIDLTNYFNMQTNTTDNITEWNNKFVTTSEKNTWNWKQDALTPWNWITINNGVISADGYTEWHWIDIDGNNVVTNELPFEPENAWVLGQVLKKTSTGYRWNNEVDWFDPENAGTTGQVLKKTATGYQWANESWWGGWGWGWWGGWVTSVNGRTWAVTVRELPSWWNSGEVLTKTSTGYAWMVGSNTHTWLVDSNSISSATLEEIIQYVLQGYDYGAILKDSRTEDIFIYSGYSTESTGTVFKFLWLKHISKKYESNRWDYTTGWENVINITVTTNPVTYSYELTKNDNDDPNTNYLSVLGAGYTTAFMPTEDYQPATKQYVDQAVLGGGGWVLGITNDTTHTSYTITKERAGTQADYDYLVNNWLMQNGVVYNIIPSS